MTHTPENKSSGIRPRLHQLCQVLSEADLHQIQDASLRLLERVGVKIEHAQALHLLRANGARVEGERAFIPERLVARALDSAPAKFTLYARDPRKHIYLGEGNIHFTNGFGATWVLDLETHQVREATLADLAQHTRLADALERVDYILFSVVPQDVPPRLLDVECTATVLQNTGKHVQLSLETAEWVDEVIQIARAIVGEDQALPISAGGVPNSPLGYSYDVAEKFMRLARNNIPCFIVVGAMAGATAPVTLAGMLALQNAEWLCGVVIHQLANPGAPVAFGTFSGGFDMRHGKLALGGPEVTLITASSQQLANLQHLPMAYATGGISDSPTVDVQCGYEKAFTVLGAALAGVEVIHDGASGLLGAGMLGSPAQMVIDDEMCKAVAYALAGIPVDAESLAEEVTATVAADGNFLGNEHTAKHFRQALYLTSLRSRNLLPTTVEPERSILFENAVATAKRLLSTHQPLPIPAERLKIVERIVQQAREKVGL